MTCVGFTETDFSTFIIDGLDERMGAIRERIQPKFQLISEQITPYLAEILNQEMYSHIARHARRTVNPPNDTWIAFSHHKRGYKKHPHFQVGLWDDRLFIWLAYIYELPNKQTFAQRFIDYEEELAKIILPDDDISLNHMKKSDVKFNDVELITVLERFYKVKSAEFLIGKQFKYDDPIVQDGEQLLSEIKAIFKRLTPIYQLSLEQIT